MKLNASFFKPTVACQTLMLMYLVYEAFSFLAALWKETATVGDKTADRLYMETQCGMNIKLRACECECAYLFLVLLVSPPSAQLVAAACLEIRPATLVQHPRRFPLPLAKRSETRH